MHLASLDDLKAGCHELHGGDPSIEAAARAHQAELTKPPGSLGRLEDVAVWLARWQRQAVPRIDHPAILVFAGNHGVTAQNVSAYPPAVTVQMVANFASGGAAINQLAKLAAAKLSVVPIALDRPTGDFTRTAAMDEAEFLAAVEIGYRSVPDECDLLALGEMGIGNTTAAAAMCAALLGGKAEQWVGRGTGLDDAGLSRKRAVVEAALARHAAILGDPLKVAATLGGRELAAIMGATLAAHHRQIPTVLDGFITTAAVLPLAKIDPRLLGHCIAAHVSAEAGHGSLLEALGLRPLLSLDMRLGEATGAATAILLLRAAVACHAGMATFAEAGVAGRVE